MDIQIKELLLLLEDTPWDLRCHFVSDIFFETHWRKWPNERFIYLFLHFYKNVKRSIFHKNHNNLKYTTLGWEPASITHKTRPGSSMNDIS